MVQDDVIINLIKATMDFIKGTYLEPKFIWAILKQLFETKYSSVVNDPRSELEKFNDYKVGTDIALGTVLNAGKRVTKLPFKAYSQGKSSACGAFAASHARKLYEGEDNFAYHWYRNRSNFSNEGMYLKDVLKLMAQAISLEPNKAYTLLTETEANALPLENVFSESRKLKYEYAQFDAYDTDSLFSVVAEGFPVLFAFYSTVNEWTEIMEPTDAVTLFTAPVRHYVIALPNSNHTKDGKEWVSVIDSSHNKGFSLRQVSKDFLKSRMYMGGGFYYPSKSRKTKVTSIPLIPVQFGSSNVDVLTLQTFLYQEGFLSKVHTTGYYGNRTASAVLEWQKTYLTDENLNDLIELKGYFWGPKSIKKASKLYK